jgi:hypothetical protein
VSEVVLDVEHMNPLEPPPDDWIGPLRRIGEKRRSSWPAIERSLERRLLAGKRLCVLMLLGNSSIVDKDVFAALGGHARAYHLTPQRIQLTTPAAVAATLSALKADADLVAIVRGGGEGFSALSDRQVVETLAHQMSTPTISAVGHPVNQPRLHGVVSHVCTTPTALGAWLAACVTTALFRRTRRMPARLCVALGVFALLLVALWADITL